MCGRPCKLRATCIVYELACLGCRRTRRMRLRGAIQLGLLTERFVVLVPVDYRPWITGVDHRGVVVLVPVDYRPRITGVDHRGVCRPCTSRLQAADNRTRPPRGCCPCTSRLQAADNRTRPPRGLSSLYQSTTGRG